MKIKVPNDLLTIDILTILLVVAIIAVPWNAARIVLGLPFLLFFPGYTLVAALFVKKESSLPPNPETAAGGPSRPQNEGMESKGGLDRIERIALSFGMSIAVTALLGLGLNYTPWGIRLFPVMWSITGFILLMSGIAWFRRARAHNPTPWTVPMTLRLPGWEGSTLNKTLTLILAVAIVGAVGMLGYAIAFPKTGEKFTEFYILGNNGKAENYPSAFTLRSGQVINVQYGDNGSTENAKLGQVSLGIVNHEQQAASYVVKIVIDGQPVNINLAGKSLSQLDGINLQQGEKWEQSIGFAPQHTGNNQKVEFFLYKDGSDTAEDSLHLWVNVKAP